MTIAGAIAAGIAFVHQELNLFDNLDAAANVFIGREPLWAGPLRLVDRPKLEAAARPSSARLGVDFPPDAPVIGLSLAQRQLIEIAKALSLESRLVIMDEPTSSLTLSETDRLLKVIADLQAVGGQRHLHLAPAGRGQGLRRPRRGAARRAAGRAAGAGRDLAGGDDPADDRPRPEVDLPPARGAAGRSRCSRSTALRTAA